MRYFVASHGAGRASSNHGVSIHSSFALQREIKPLGTLMMRGRFFVASVLINLMMLDDDDEPLDHEKSR